MIILFFFNLLIQSYNENTLLMAAICDFGPSGKYLVANLLRNKKVYISIDDYSDQVYIFKQELSAKSFKIGQFVVGVLVTPKKAEKL